jgi:hemerythrin-like domain-containing protein
MTKYLEQNIKDLIGTYPPIGALLEEYKIACVSCNAGSCKLRDIVDIHNLPAATEDELFIKIMAIIEPGRKVTLPPRTVKKTGGGPLSPPLRMLVGEHTQIKRVLALIPRLAGLLLKEFASAQSLVEETLFFIQNYADRYHHAKEEDLLFKRFDPNLDIINVMLEEHNAGRELRKDISRAAGSGDPARAASGLLAFQKLLTEHIQKEDEILYPWMERTMPVHAVGELFAQFNELEPKFSQVKERCLAWVVAAEGRLPDRPPV